MFETTPQQPAPDSIDLTELADPLASLIAAELASRFIRLCMCRTEPIVARLAKHEVALGRAGGIDLDKRRVAQLLYREIDSDVFGLVARTVPLAQAAPVLSRIEALLREQFAEVIGTAASYLLSDGREAAIQMATVATTMAAREVRTGVAEIIAQTREPEDQDLGTGEAL